MNKETRSLVAEMRVAVADDGSKSISGLIPYNSLSVDLGGYKEIIAPSAFADAVSGNADVLALRDHTSTMLLGRTKSRTLTLEDTPDGLRYTIKLPNTSAANDLAESISRGDLDSTSFGFICIDDTWTVTESDVIRTLRQVELLEVSPCSFPAYPDSSVSLRSAPREVRSLIEGQEPPVLNQDVEPVVADNKAIQDHIEATLILLRLK